MYTKKTELLNFCYKIQKLLLISYRLNFDSFALSMHELNSALSRFFGFYRVYLNPSFQDFPSHKILGSNNIFADCFYNFSSMAVLSFMNDHKKLHTDSQAG